MADREVFIARPDVYEALASEKEVADNLEIVKDELESMEAILTPKEFEVFFLGEENGI